MSPKKNPALPLKDVMAAIDKKDRNFYTNLSAEQKKAFSAWMMMRYCSSVQGRDAANYIYMTNELNRLMQRRKIIKYLTLYTVYIHI